MAQIGEAAAAACILGGMIVLVVESRRRLPVVEPELTDLLTRVGALQGLPRPARELLAAAASPAEEIPAGTRMLRQGEPADEVNWFGCLAKIAEQFHDMPAVQTQATAAIRFVKYHHAEARPIAREMDRLLVVSKQTNKP